MSRSLLNSLMVCLLVVALSLASKSSSALPIDEESTDDSDKRTMLLEKYLELGNRLRGLHPEQEYDVGPGLYIPPSISNLLKRSGSPRSSRSGGMSLCLWKVCPAAPWLINK